MIFRNIFSGFSCESKGDSSDEFYARSSSRVELLRFSDARSPENRHSGLGRRRNRGWNFYVDFLLVSLFLLYLYKTKKERLLVAGKAGSASGIRRTSGAEYGRRPAGFRPGRERSRSRITRQMKTILSLVALLAATAGLRGQGGASADDSGPAPDALREWSVEETDALLSGLLAAYDDSWEALSRFRFSFVRYAPRGYDRSRSRFLLAGVDLADPATGAVRWGAMTALREARVSGSVWGGVLPRYFRTRRRSGTRRVRGRSCGRRAGRALRVDVCRTQVSLRPACRRKHRAHARRLGRFCGRVAPLGTRRPHPGRLFRRLDRLCGGRQTLGRASFADGVVRRGSFQSGGFAVRR